jgi:hypothetical protein
MNIPVKANKIYILLLSLLALTLLSACSSPAPAANLPKEPLSPPDRVDLVYFYSDEECHCQEIVGEDIQAALLVNFNIELTSGKLTYQSLNLDDTENAIIAYKYRATPESLFINIVRADAENIIAVPEILLVKDDDVALFKLVTTRVQQALDGEE